MYYEEKNKEIRMTDITIFDLLNAVRRKLVYVVLSAVVLGGASFLYSNFLIQEKYTSTTQMLVNIPAEKIDMQLNNSQIQANSKLITTYADIIRGDSVLSEAKKEAGITDSNEKIRKMIEVISNRDSQVFALEVTTTSAKESADLANAITNAFEKQLSDIYQNSQTFTVLSPAIENPVPVAPNTRNNTIFGVLAGLVLSIIIFIVAELLNTKVRDEKIIEELGLTNLGSINALKKDEIEETRLERERGE